MALYYRVALGDPIALNVRVCIINKRLLCTSFTCFCICLFIPFIVSFYPPLFFYLVKEGGFKSMEGVYGRRAFFVSSMTLKFLFWCPMCVCP